MYERLMALYLDGRLDLAGLDRAVTKGWITTDERDAIVAAGQAQPTA